MKVRHPLAGVVIDEAQQRLLCEPDALVRAGAAVLVRGLRDRGPGRVPAPDDLPTLADAYRRRVAPLFERWVGRPPAGVPVWLRVGIEAGGTTGPTPFPKGATETEVGLFVEVPRDAIAGLPDSRRPAEGERP